MSTQGFATLVAQWWIVSMSSQLTAMSSVVVPFRLFLTFLQLGFAQVAAFKYTEETFLFRLTSWLLQILLKNVLMCEEAKFCV